MAKCTAWEVSLLKSPGGEGVGEREGFCLRHDDWIYQIIPHKAL